MFAGQVCGPARGQVSCPPTKANATRSSKPKSKMKPRPLTSGTRATQGRKRTCARASDGLLGGGQVERRVGMAGEEANRCWASSTPEHDDPTVWRRWISSMQLTTTALTQGTSHLLRGRTTRPRFEQHLLGLRTHVSHPCGRPSQDKFQRSPSDAPKAQGVPSTCLGAHSPRSINTTHAQ